MFAKSTIAVALFAASHVAAQGTTSNATIDPSTISATLKAEWCSSEINTCGTLCIGNFDSNTCDPTSLNFTCTCSNGSAPGLQFYSESMDALVCQTIYNNCIVAGENDAAAQKVCTANRDANCGTLSTANFTAPSSTSSSSSASATPTTAGTSGSTAPSTSSSKAAAATMLALGREYGSGVVAVGVAAAFGLML